MYYIIYGFLWLVSLLPLPILYFLGDGVYGLVFYVLKYRREVVMNNLFIAFPEKTGQERLKIAKKFYHNLVDAFIESLKFITISRKKIRKRCTHNLHIINELTDNGHKVHIMLAHQFNLEFFNAIAAMSLTAPFVGVYLPVTNKSINKIIYDFRGKFGTILISAKDYQFRMHKIFLSQYTLGLVADQNPGNPSRAYWMNFFGKPAPFTIGPAKGAVKGNCAVVMVDLKKNKRGYYQVFCKILTEGAAAYTPQQLTVLYKNEVERIIQEDPANYLWSHRRWKYEWKKEYTPVLL